MSTEKKYIRICPSDNCSNVIRYKRIYDMKSADEKVTLCKDCRYVDITVRNEKIITYLNTELTQKEIANLLNVSVSVVNYVKKKYNIIRTPKLSISGRKIRSINFKENVLNKKLNVFGGSTTESYKKTFKSRYGYEYSEFLEKEGEFKKYYKKVRNKTNKSLKKYKHLFNNLDNLGKCGDAGKYQVDHIYSIKEGFNNGVTPELIGHPSNLRVIPWEYNLRKYTDCEITLNSLIHNAAIFLTNNDKILITEDDFLNK